MGARVVARGLASSVCLMWKIYCALRNPGSSLFFALGCLFDSGRAVEPLDRSIASQLRFYPIERSLLCQASPQRLCRFTAALGERGHFFIDVFVGHVDLLSGGDVVENELCLHIGDRAVALLAPKRRPIDVHCSRINTLHRKRPYRSLQSRIHLTLNESFGHREIVLLHQSFEDSVACLGLLAFFLGRLKAFANLLSQLVECRHAARRSLLRRSRASHILREFVVELR